jgi:hypothetical protein
MNRIVIVLNGIGVTDGLADGAGVWAAASWLRALRRPEMVQTIATRINARQLIDDESW